MAMGDRIHPSHGKTTESVVVSDEDAQVAPTTSVDSPQEDAAELSQPHIEPVALTDAPGS